MKNQELKQPLEYQEDFWNYQEEDDFVDIIPDKVREAIKVFVELAKIILDESNSDKTVREAVFSKIPKEKIKEASDTFKEWDEELKQMKIQSPFFNALKFRVLKSGEDTFE